MPRRKSAVNVEIKPWLSANRDCREGRFIQVGNSLLLSDHFNTLSAGGRYIYLCMAMESGGKREFQFPQTSFTKYNIAPSCARRYIKELIRNGYIVCSSGQCIRKPNNYIFSFEWKSC